MWLDSFDCSLGKTASAFRFVSHFVPFRLCDWHNGFHLLDSSTATMNHPMVTDAFVVVPHRVDFAIFSDEQVKALVVGLFAGRSEVFWHRVV